MRITTAFKYFNYRLTEPRSYLFALTEQLVAHHFSCDLKKVNMRHIVRKRNPVQLDRIMTELPRQNKEDLGEILYKKVEEILKPEDGSLPSIITGMLLEMSSEEISCILQDDESLRKCVNTSLYVLQNDKKVPKDTCTVADQQLFPSNPNSSEEIEDVLFKKVFSLEPQLAPYLTGMILELDHNIVAEVVKDEHQLLQAVEKAKKSFLHAHGADGLQSGISLHPLSSPSSSSSSTPAPMVPATSHRIVNMPAALLVEHVDRIKSDLNVDESRFHEKKEEEFGLLVFQRAEFLHKDDAPEISGMILEMDYLSLKRVVADTALLDQAISKAYAVLSSQKNCKGVDSRKTTSKSKD